MGKFRQFLSPIVSKLLIQDTNQNLGKPLDNTYLVISKILSQIRWFQVLYVGGRWLATIDQLLTVSLVVDKL